MNHRTLTVTQHQGDSYSKATSSLILVKMIAKLETTQSNAYKNKDQTQSPHKQWETIKQ